MSYQGLKGWMESETFDGLRASALSNVWFPFQQWNDVAAEGGLRIITEGHGAKIKDFQGKEYYDGFAGLALVNVGYGREEIARAVYDQISTLHYANTFAFATIPDACPKLTNRLADNGLLTRVSQYLLLAPALTVSRQEVDEIVDIVSDGISYIEKELGY